MGELSKVYVVLFEDRHTDVDAQVFSDKSMAIERAKVFAHDNDRHGYYAEHQAPGWVFHAVYSSESDCVTVLEREVDGRSGQEAG